LFAVSHIVCAHVGSPKNVKRRWCPDSVIRGLADHFGRYPSPHILPCQIWSF